MTQKQIVAASEAGRIDVVLAKDIKISRSQASKAIKDGFVAVDTVTVSQSSFKVKAGQTIEYTPVEEKPAAFLKPKEKVVIDYVYQDDDIAIVNKPRGMVVHPAPGHQDDTLVNYLFDNDEKFDFDPSDTENVRPGIVHRIDKDTQGLLAIAMNTESQKALQEEIKEHDFHRYYLALVYGNVKDKKFKIDAPLTRPNHTQRKALVDVYNGREAITHCTLLGNNGKVSLLKCSLETGRTHQIRAHLAYIGYPIVGDKLYGSRLDKIATKGQCLTAYELSIIHPRTLQRMNFYAPIDDYFKELLNYYFK